MLEVSHLTKIYKSKGGVEVKALNDVSVSFPETGMVFLLGKSGSGKSTLLNVCGGLDDPTSGEIIVKGRSSKDFSQSDFDSYRNTFIGFIFQEYNILNEFTVEENIALALELQNKPKDKEAINALLEKVDLSGFAKRKPNTLSGGQKQRIAIARALIKSPEIIMADEPTGALDSATGKQVLDTLKKLSKDTLVIVVSHDREFAETYGDRIIELKDGKIISDISKVNEVQEQLSKNISVLGETLCIKKGSELDKNDLEEIVEFIKTTDKDVILSKGEKDIKTFKKVSRINDNGEKEVFKDTDESKLELKKYNKEDSRFIRSKLPIRHAFKIGASGLKTKPIRLLFTIILCTISFIMFGILSTMIFYDSESTFKQTLRDSDYSMIKLGKEYLAKETGYSYGEEMWSYSYPYETRFSESEFKNYVNQFGRDTFAGINVNIKYNVQSTSSSYWVNEIEAFAYLSSDNSLRGKINGTYPKTDDEIVISSYTADVIFNSKIYDGKTNKLLNLSKPEDIIGKHITLGNQTYKVVGILESGEIDSKYDELLNGEGRNYQLLEEYTASLYDDIHLIAFVTENRLSNISKEYPEYSLNGFDYRTIVSNIKNGEYVFDTWSNSSYDLYSHKYDSDVIFLTDKKEPGANEVIITSEMLGNLLMNYYEDKMVMGDANVSANYDLASQIMQKGIHTENGFIAFTKQEMNSKINKLINDYKKTGKKLKIGFKLFDNNMSVAIGDIVEVEVIGILDIQLTQYNNSVILLSEKQYNDLLNIQKTNVDFYIESETKYESVNSIYQTIYVPFNHTEEEIQTLWNIYGNDKYSEDDSRMILTSYITQNLQMVDSLVDELSTILLYVGLVIMVFAILLFSNFITVSISNKKKAIGILRAVGARSVDVFKIFFSESFVITLICLLLSTVGCIMVCGIVNKEIASIIPVSIFVFGIVSLLLLIIIALLTAIVATFLPVYNAARKKPVDSIRAL